jgi:transcription termination/antitermination protein NusA
MQSPRTEFSQALKAIAQERGLDPSVILETIKQAIIAAYKRDARERGEDVEAFDYDVDLNSSNGEVKVYSWPLPSEEATEEEKEAAKKGKKDITPPGFGRIAAQTAKQVIHQKIREAEKGVLMDEYQGRVGSLISGMILRFDGPDVRIDLGKTEGIMPKEERIPTERLNANQRLTFLLKAIEDTPKGKIIILSRSEPVFVQKLFEREVPEMSSRSVEVKAIAREPGVRTKMAVFSNQSGVDPVGSCVGQKGVRVQAVTNELGGERVDIISWTENAEDLVTAALAPAEGISVSLDKETKTANVKAPEEQLSLAIGRDGQNARLAAKLTGWKIEVKALPGTEKKEEIKNDGVNEDVKTVEPENKEEIADTPKEDLEEPKMEAVVEKLGTEEKAKETDAQAEEATEKVEDVKS